MSAMRDGSRPLIPAPRPPACASSAKPAARACRTSTPARAPASETPAAAWPQVAAAELQSAPFRQRDQIRCLRISVIGKALILGGAGFCRRRGAAPLQEVPAGQVDGGERRSERLAVAPLAERRRARGPVVAARIGAKHDTRRLKHDAAE